MPQQKTAGHIRVLSDLLQLDEDAIRSYQIAIDALASETHKETLRGFKRDHQRHIRDLKALIREAGGEPLAIPHLSTGFLKLAVQSLGAAGGDRAVILAFRSNEWEAARKYARAARGRHPEEVKAVLRRGAEDEQRHYRWAVETLAAMGAANDTVIGRMEQVLERIHGGAAMGLEALEALGVGLVSSARGGGTVGKTARKKPATGKRGSSSSKRAAR